MLNVAMLSMWHVHANGYAEFINSQPDARVAAIWDDDELRGRAAAEKFGTGFEPELDKLLARADIGAVVVNSPTTEHVDLMVRAAQAGKHIFTEKALAPTVAECEEVAKAVRAAGVQFVISFPGLTSGSMQYAKKAIDEGRLGKVTYLRIRAAHGGSSQHWLPGYWYDESKTGGGAMMDLGCHPNYQASYLLGKPVRVASMFVNVMSPGDSEDNAVSTIEFEGGAIAVLETGFVSPFSPSAIEIQGTEGSIFIEGGKLRISSMPSGISGWLEPSDLPKPLPVALRQFIDAATGGEPARFTLDGAIELTELLENEYKAHREQRVIKLR